MNDQTGHRDGQKHSTTVGRMTIGPQPRQGGIARLALGNFVALTVL
jgi:hypothetical protein